MGSQSHLQGVPQRPGLASRRDFISVQERHREISADIRDAIYVRPLGRGLHLVRNFCNDKEYVVGAAVPVSYSPGSKVFLASNTGHPGEVIMGGPPPGRRGASIFGNVTVLRSAPVLIEAEEGSHPYLAVSFSGTTIYAYSYTDGTFGAEIANASFAAVSLGTVNSVALVSLSPLVVAVLGTNDVMTWNIDTNTVNDGGHNPAHTASLLGGVDGVAYWAENTSFGRYSLWRINAAGVVTRVSPAYPDDEVFFDGVELMTTSFLLSVDEVAVAVFGDPGDRGYLRLSEDPSVFVASDDFLPITVTSEEWSYWSAAHRVPGEPYAISAYGNGVYNRIGLMDTSVPSGSIPAMDTHNVDYFNPSPDGESVVLIGSGQMARTSYAAPNPTWITLDNTALGDQPWAFFCLD
jgi:hypothetical protein